MNREYGRRLYVDGKYDMSKVTEKLMGEEFAFRNSEFKKPYLTDNRGKLKNYAKMEYSWNPTHWDGGGGFDMPANFPATRNNGYPGLGMRYIFGCKGERIGYTTANMFNAESQELTIENGKSFNQYDWEVIGNGGTTFDLSDSWTTTDGQGNGKTTYSPTNAKGNITIQLKSRDTREVCDEITMFVGPAGGWGSCTWVAVSGAPAMYGGFPKLAPDPVSGSGSRASDWLVTTSAYYRLPAFNSTKVSRGEEYFYYSEGECFGYDWTYSGTCDGAGVNYGNCGGGVTMLHCASGSFPQKCNL